ENVTVHKINLPLKKFKRERVYPAFTETEKDRHLKYLSSFKQTYGYVYLESGHQFVPLFHPQFRFSKESIVVGPITPGKQTFFGNNGLKTTYQHTGGYTYAFEDNIVYKLNADKLIPDRLYYSTFKPMPLINDKVMTKKEFRESGSYDSRWHPRSINLIDGALTMKVLLPQEKSASGFAAFLFENTLTKKIISPCESFGNHKTDFNVIPRGLYNVIAIYNNGTYLKMDSINFKSHTIMVLDLGKSALHPLDSLFGKWISAANKECFPTTEPRVIRMRHSSSTRGNIKGTVYSAEDNSPLPGVNVVIKGTEIGTVTDIEGRFEINADVTNVTLVFSFIGLKTEELETQVGSDITVSMQSDVMQLSEVVVTAYGLQSKSRGLAVALSGSVAGLSISNPDVVKAETKEKNDAEQREGEERLYNELLQLNTIRSHFNDVGFWEPKLFTDKQGQSKFNITFPDDITRWEATVYAMNRHLQTGTARKSIKSYKPIMAELNVPNFLTRGDFAFFIGKVSNYSQEQNIKGKIKWSNSESNLEKEIQFSGFNSDRLPVNATTTDSVTTSYVFTRDDGYMDGEKRTVPVVEQGIVRADGTLSILKNKEDAHVKAALNKNVTVEILANPIDIYAGEAKYLLNYKYDCNEQLASKLLGLINYRLVMRYEGKPFAYDKDVNKIIARLLKNQNQEFLWSWWDVSPATSYWMSAHILRALKVANEAGYQVDLSIENISRKAEYKFDIQQQYSLRDADLLQALAIWNAKLNYAKYIKRLDTLIQETLKPLRIKNRYHYYPYSLLNEKLLLQEVRQLVKLPYQRDSLLHYQKNGILGDVHFSDDKLAGYWYDDELTANVIAYRMGKRDSLLRKLVAPMQLYFLAERKKGAWNTYYSSSVVSAILPDLLAEGTSRKESFVNLTGKVRGSINKFPYRVELFPQEELHASNNSGFPIYFMQYKKERVINAKTGVDGFEIKTTLGNNSSSLQAGKPVNLTVEVNIKKEASLEYIMLEVPIPGACSYADKTQSGNAVETHREYFKDRTLIFCEKMRAGKYSFVIQLLPRFTGKYFINPAQVSLMYVPVVNANTDMKSVRVK
ncbi:MAG TPA: hypothetical protein DGG95_12960, partial [Cytophagales bacterium]|nr:hypothetical protein [Cytophagales bacterium]